MGLRSRDGSPECVEVRVDELAASRGRAITRRKAPITMTFSPCPASHGASRSRDGKHDVTAPPRSGASLNGRRDSTATESRGHARTCRSRICFNGPSVRDGARTRAIGPRALAKLHWGRRDHATGKRRHVRGARDRTQWLHGPSRYATKGMTTVRAFAARRLNGRRGSATESISKPDRRRAR